MRGVDAFLLEEGDEVVWEDFHENSKTSRAQPHVYFDRYPSDRAVVTMMRGLRETKPYLDRDAIALPAEPAPSEVSLDEALLGRASARGFAPGPIALADLAKVLQCAQGVTRDNADSAYPRPFRTVPSGGALYPLEVYVWARHVDGLREGLYHYDPTAHDLAALDGPVSGPSVGDAPGTGTSGQDLTRSFVQPELAGSAAAAVLVSAVFFRSVFKYGDRGYRFVLLEAGHLVQNALLAALGRGLAGVPIGGYLDREVDRALNLDGLHESVVYAFLLGRPES